MIGLLIVVICEGRSSDGAAGAQGAPVIGNSVSLLGKMRHVMWENMIVDYMTKPLIGVKFKHFRKLIMNLLSQQSLPRPASRSVLDNMMTH
jgi:hypothetical protein